MLPILGLHVLYFLKASRGGFVSRRKTEAGLLAQIGETDMLQKILVWTFNTSLIWSGLAYAASPSSPEADASPSYEQASEGLDRFLNLVSELRSHIDRSQFDPEALLDELEYEADAIESFVAEEILFEPYVGLLRGAQGTLMSRAGNSLDQSVLLATLLGDAGFETRLARGALPSGETRRLVTDLKPSTATPIGDQDFADLVRPYETRSPESATGVTLLETPMWKTVMKTAEALGVELAAAGIKLESRDVTSQLSEEAGDYFWVEYRLGPAESWKAAHPAFGSGDPPKRLDATEYFGSSIPSELQHRVRIQTFIERKLGDHLETVAVMSPWERPTANLAGLVLSYSNIPNGLNEKVPLNEVQSVIENSNFFVPTLNGVTAPDAVAFDLKGRTIDLSALQLDAFGAGALFQTVGDNVERAASALGALGEEADTALEPLQALNAHWAEFTLISPAGEETAYRRYTLYRPGDGARLSGSKELDHESAKADLAWRLSSPHIFNVMTGRTSSAHFADRYLERILETRPVLEGLVHTAYTGETSWLLEIETLPSQLDLQELFLLGDAVETGHDAVAYRAQPSLAIVHTDFQSNGLLSSSMDIVTNRKRVVRLEKGEVRTDPNRAVELGVWETATERLIQRGFHPEATGNDTFTVMRKASAQDIDSVVVRPQQADASLRLGLTEDERLRLLEDLDRGYVVVAPGARPELPLSGWWRVDPVTGTTLGMTSDGRGQASMEYAILLAKNAQSLKGRFKQFKDLGEYIKDCEAKPSTSEQLCCLMKGYVEIVGGYALDQTLGPTIGVSSNVLFRGIRFIFNVHGVEAPTTDIVCRELDPTPLDNF